MSPTKRATAVATAVVATAALTMGAHWLLYDDREPVRAADLETSRLFEQPQRLMIDGREWRWESNRGIELQVPADWGYQVVGGDWCARERKPDDDAAPGGVSRGRELMKLIVCSSPFPPLGQRKPSVTFHSYDSPLPTRLERLDGGWVAESRLIDGRHVSVFTDDDEVRTRIFGSARTVEGTDVYGCPVDHEATAGRDYRPDPGRGGLAAVGDVENISVCRYYRDDAKAPDRPLLSSSLLTADAARQVVDAMLAAPKGGGPNSPGGCIADYDYGEEMLVLTVRGTRAEQEVVLRYDGCIGHGTDDGVTKRSLTRESVEPLLDGPHRPDTMQSYWSAR